MSEVARLAALAPTAIDDVVAALRADVGGIARQRPNGAAPSRAALAEVARGLRAALYPAHFGPAELRASDPDDVDGFVARALTEALGELHAQVCRALAFAGDGERAASARAREIVDAFTARLPQVRALLDADIRAAFNGDPAAQSIDEAVLCYPGVTAIFHHRLAHPLARLGVPLVPRILAEIAHADTGIDLHPGAEIGGSFFIDHGTGVVVGETSRIGERVRIYQGVTLGARSFPSDAEGRIIKGQPRHPVVEDDVVIYAGATILGRITIGRGSSIGGNVWLTRSVPAFSRITQAQVRSDVYDEGAGI
ncbi:MAG: serine O-acetyltransferase [Deltaproteobacteria bacterium]|nr:serine O-acetyltransferase [Deltaproteobacteria bacterium]